MLIGRQQASALKFYMLFRISSSETHVRFPEYNHTQFYVSALFLLYSHQKFCAKEDE